MLLTAAKMDESQLDWQSFISGGGRAERPQFSLRPDQKQALDNVLNAFKTNDRCRMIMACGTGKTFVSLRIAEAMAPRGTILFCAPSIALVSQACASWNSLAAQNMRFLAVCSDSKASDTKNDTAASSLADLPYPATTNAKTLAANYWHMRRQGEAFTVIFTTYQSMPVIAEAHLEGLPAFDLIVCDEAHRTTGAADEKLTALQASAFQLVHHDEHIPGKKRLYMTATPRIYTAQAQKSKRGETCLFASMDDEAIYGPEAHYMPFDQAVEQGLLSDYRVVVLAVREEAVSPLIQEEISDGAELKLDEACKILGCYKGLVWHGEGRTDSSEPAAGNSKSPSACHSETSPSCHSEIFSSCHSETVSSCHSERSEESESAASMYNQGESSDGEAYEPLIVADFSPSGQAAEAVPPLHRAVGFCHSIKASKLLNRVFNKIVDRYREQSGEKIALECELEHVDGTMDSNIRHKILRWLAEDNGDPQSCRLLTNARCLAEGVDVPALDAVIFFSPRKSKVDIIQAVGRVMRTFKGKKYGYIILPVFVPYGMTPEEALDNSSSFDVIWEVLQALRSHDRRIDARINAVTLQQKNAAASVESARVGELAAEGGADGEAGEQLSLELPSNARLQKAIYTKLVKKCGDRVYWESWSADVARMAQEHIKHLGDLIASREDIKASFERFLQGLREILNPGISAAQAVEMVTQHMITVPIFNALFKNFQFKDSNPVSQTIERFLNCLPSRQVTENADDLASLGELYDNVARRARSISNAAGRQQLIKDLYEKFFSEAFRATKDKLGIVYTPSEVVEFILQFSNTVLRERFGKSLSDKDVHILDGFAGTGTFTAQLIANPQLMPAERLPYKYAHELHSNEILLLAYYIMAVNIEQTYHRRLQLDTYEPFPGAVLTDTFQMHETDDSLDSEVFSANHARARSQKEQKISVIIGNPPYSAGQKSANDNNQNEKYPRLDKRIADTYAISGKAVNQRNIYDSYIRAFRWASDRIGDKGLICFVSNAGWLRAPAMDGLRRCLREDFSALYVFDLRGNARTKGEERRKEKDNVFGEGSRAPIAVSLLVKDGAQSGPSRIYYHDIGDYLTRGQKFKALLEAAGRCSLGASVREVLPWRELEPDSCNDWLDQRSDEFYAFAPMGNKAFKTKDDVGCIFAVWCLGLTTNRDTWAYNYSKTLLRDNIEQLIKHSNAEIGRFNSISNSELSYDPRFYSWTRALRQKYVNKNVIIQYNCDNYTMAQYRPFCRQFAYYDRAMNEYTYQMPKIFPLPSESGSGLCMPDSPEQFSLNLNTLQLEPAVSGSRERLKNVVITLTLGKQGGSVLAARYLPDLHFNGDCQCFPYYWYEPVAQDSIFADSAKAAFIRHEAITDTALRTFAGVYPQAYAQRVRGRGGAGLNKLDIFCYIYAVLHHPEYKKRFAVNLNKELPRIPFVGGSGCATAAEERIRNSQKFEAFAEIGRQLLQLHINYEEAEPYKAREVWSKKLPEGVGPDNPGPVTKLAWGKKKDPESQKSVEDYTRLIYNANLTLEGLPERAQDYVVNGYSALDWVIDRYQVKVDKATEIRNDPNEFAPENPRYILELIKKVLTVAVRSLDLIDRLGDMALSELPQPDFYPSVWQNRE
ncbi:DEAD/DEAH box helicase [bacterium]|nr:DEAD/DEAH box helicase [bacterium]